MKISDVLHRQEQAELLRDGFLAELSLACGRTEDSLLEEFRALGDRSEPSWYPKCALILQDMQRGLSDGLTVRVRDAQRGNSRDMESERVWEWAREYFAPLRQAQLRLKPSIPTAESQLAACLLEHCFEAPRQLPEARPEEKALQRLEKRDAGIERMEFEAQANLGKSIRVLATVLGSLAFLFTQAVVIIPLVLVAWVMAYALIDQRALPAQKEEQAIKSELPLMLIATLEAADPAYSIATILQTDTNVLLHRYPNDKIRDGVMIQRIEQGRVVLRNGARLEYLEINMIEL